MNVLVIINRSKRGGNILIKNSVNGFMITMLLLGLDMIFEPEIYNRGTKLNFGNPDTVYAGIFFTCIGGVILLNKFRIWYLNKKNEKHHDNSNS